MIDEVYLSTDIEADGPIPGPHSMLSFASAAYLADATRVGTFSANLELLPNAAPHPRTMQWWAKFPDAWRANRTNCLEPRRAMADYLVWVKALPGTPVFVGFPGAFDFMFVQWYLMHFLGESPFAHSALDMKTLAMALMNCHYLAASKRNMPPAWFEDLPHTHIALDDAVEQGALFCSMLRELRGRAKNTQIT